MIPNKLLDNIQELTGSELKVLLVICRQTIGWQKESDTISLTQFQDKTGYQRAAVNQAIQQLEQKELIEITRSKGKSNTYQLPLLTSMESELVANGTSMKSELHQFGKRTGTSMKSEHTKETYKKTIQKKGSAPAREEVEDYFREKGKMLEKDIPLEAEKFINYYEDRNWKNSSGDKIENWHRQAGTWQARYQQFNEDRLQKASNNHQPYQQIV